MTVLYIIYSERRNYYEQKNNDNYFKIDKVGQNETGYYYYYSKTSNKYDVFRSNVKSKKQKKSWKKSALRLKKKPKKTEKRQRNL